MMQPVSPSSICPQTRQPCAAAATCHNAGESAGAGATCAGAAHTHVALPLAELLARCDREASFGVCDTGRARCRFFSWGQGPPLLFIPGLATDARCFVPLCGPLRARFRCIAFDWPAAPASHAELTALLPALLDQLQIPQAYIAGFSFGSTVALAALHRYPERFPRGILLSGFAQRRLGPAEVLLARLLRHCRGPMRRLPFHQALLKRSHYRPFAQLPPELWQFFLDRCGALPMDAVARRALLLHAADLRPCLPEIRQPVLLVSGDEDALVSGQCLETLQRGLPVNVHVELQHCGHYGLLTHPGELAGTLTSFLTPPSTATAACGAESCTPAPQ